MLHSCHGEVLLLYTNKYHSGQHLDGNTTRQLSDCCNLSDNSYIIKMSAMNIVSGKCLSIRVCPPVPGEAEAARQDG